MIEFCQNFAWAMIHNDFIEEENSERIHDTRRRNEMHKLLKAPTGCKSYVGGKWIKNASKKYQQYKCRTHGCKKQIRTYCACNVGHWMCQECYLNHCIEVNR